MKQMLLAFLLVSRVLHCGSSPVSWAATSRKKDQLRRRILGYSNLLGGTAGVAAAGRRRRRRRRDARIPESGVPLVSSLTDGGGTISSASSSATSKKEASAVSATGTTDDAAAETRSKLWPPWPFNLLSSSSQRQQQQKSASSSASLSNNEDRSLRQGASVAWYFVTESVRVSIRNAQEVGSQLWFHMPPAIPPLVLLAAVPQRQKVVVGGAGELTHRTVVPLLSNPWARSVALTGTGLAILSWAHSEFKRKRLQTPLPLAEPYRNISVNRAVLPPFLPEEVPALEFVEKEDRVEEEGDDDDDLELIDSEEGLPPGRSIRRYWNQFRKVSISHTTLQTAMRDWKRMRETQRRERSNAHRLEIFDELVALQSLKRKKADQRKRNEKRRKEKGDRSDASPASLREESQSAAAPLGYALVTGASRGIGRAIAVELARWEIPLILVARDLDRLTSLAYDLEACYGVNCCVLQADLSVPGVAENIYETTKKAGLQVDILVNNAGFSSQGMSVDLPLTEVDQMIQLNAVSVSTLTHLFGRDMKERRRGRILMVSSVCGAVSGIASVAVYSATKAFENSFGISLAKEMEPYGVGVTILVPGAVRDTEFRSRSKAKQALCWNIPFYTKAPPFVAETGVRAMLRGDLLNTPGVMNRIFLQVMKPIMPMRLHNLVAEIVWNPLRWPFGSEEEEKPKTGPAVSTFVSPNARALWYNSNIRPPPRLLQLMSEKEKEETDQKQPSTEDQKQPYPTKPEQVVERSTDSTMDAQDNTTKSEPELAIQGPPKSESSTQTISHQSPPKSDSKPASQSPQTGESSPQLVRPTPSKKTKPSEVSISKLKQQTLSRRKPLQADRGGLSSETTAMQWKGLSLEETLNIPQPLSLERTRDPLSTR